MNIKVPHCIEVTYTRAKAGRVKRIEEDQERGLDICSKSWFVLERRLNVQCQQHGWIQFRHDKSRIERWRENRYNIKRNLKTNLINVCKK